MSNRYNRKGDKIKWAFTGIAFVLVFVMLAGLCLQLFAKNDKYKPSEWFKKSETEQITPDTDNSETATLSIATSQLTAKTMSATVDDNSGISLQAAITVKSYEDYISAYTVPVEYNAKVINNVFPSDYVESNGLFALTRRNADGNTGLLISKNTAQNFFSYIDKNEYTLSGITLRVFGNSDDIGTFTELEDGENYFLESPVGWTFEKCICLTFTAKTPAREPVPLPADPVKEGYTFVGWYYDRDFGIPYNGEPIYADTELFAKFEINRYKVTFDANGGNAVSSQTVNWNTSATLDTPTRVGYVFKGWYLPNGTQYTNQAIKENTTLTARWEVVMCTVTFYVDGEIYETKTVEYGTPLTTVIETANELKLCVTSVRSSNGSIGASELSNMSVTDDSLEFISEELTGTDKVFATIKTNKWQIIAGVAGGVTLIAVIGSIAGGSKRRKR